MGPESRPESKKNCSMVESNSISHIATYLRPPERRVSFVIGMILIFDGLRNRSPDSTSHLPLRKAIYSLHKTSEVLCRDPSWERGKCKGAASKDTDGTGGASN